MAEQSKYDVPTGAGKEMNIKGRVGPKTASKLGAAACIKKGGKWVGGKCDMSVTKPKEVSTLFQEDKPGKYRGNERFLARRQEKYLEQYNKNRDKDY